VMTTPYLRSSSTTNSIGFLRSPELSLVVEKTSGRGGADTPPGLAPKESLRRETQPNRAWSTCRHSHSLPEREESNDGN
jgi:hypothetical protein